MILCTKPLLEISLIDLHNPVPSTGSSGSRPPPHGRRLNALLFIPSFVLMCLILSFGAEQPLWSSVFFNFHWSLPGQSI